MRWLLLQQPCHCSCTLERMLHSGCYQKIHQPERLSAHDQMFGLRVRAVDLSENPPLRRKVPYPGGDPTAYRAGLRVLRVLVTSNLLRRGTRRPHYLTYSYSTPSHRGLRYE